MKETSPSRSALSTALVMGCTLLSRILGFVRTAVIAAVFGAGGAADVINLVFNIPNNLRKLLAEGALSTAFIPELSREIALKPDGTGARSLIANILGLQTVIILPILGLSLLFPQQVLFLFEQFDDPAKKELSTLLFRWMMPYLFLVSISAVMMALQNSYNRFFVPAVTPIMFSICVIGAVALGYGRLGPTAMGIGVLAGGFAQILIQLPSYRRLGFSLVPQWNFSDPQFRRVMMKWAPMLVTSSLFALNNQVAMLLASFLPDKSTSALANAIVFFQLPFGIFSASITTVLYPKMSRQAARGDISGLKDSLGFGYRSLWALLMPSAMILISLGEPIIAIAFQRHAFSLMDTQLTARVLAAYSVGMPFVGIFNITQRAFYALGEVRTPFFCALAAVCLDIILSLLFVFSLGGGPESLAWANSIAFIVACLLQFGLIHRKIDFSLAGETLKTFLQVMGILVVGGIIIKGFYGIFGTSWWHAGSSWWSLGLLLLIVFLVSAVILGLYALMRVEAVSIILNRGGRDDRRKTE